MATLCGKPQALRPTVHPRALTFALSVADIRARVIFVIASLTEGSGAFQCAPFFLRLRRLHRVLQLGHQRIAELAGKCPAPGVITKF